MSEISDETKVLIDTPANDSKEILKIAREMYAKLASAVPHDSLDINSLTALNAAMIAMGMFIEHGYAASNIKSKSNIEQLTYTGERQYVYDIARILAHEEIRKHFPAEE